MLGVLSTGKTQGFRRFEDSQGRDMLLASSDPHGAAIG
jgi:hypothetical protein